jgi:hypothetical protein
MQTAVAVLKQAAVAFIESVASGSRQLQSGSVAPVTQIPSAIAISHQPSAIPCPASPFDGAGSQAGYEEALE